MLEGIKAVIFDLDGTLAESMWVWEKIDLDYIEKYQLTIPDDFYQVMEGMSYTETAEYFLRVFKELPHSIEEIKQEWYEMAIEKYRNEVMLKSGAKRFLEYLKSCDIRTGIATSNDRALVEPFLEAHEVSQYLDTICTSCEVKIGKPAPDVYLKAAQNLGVVPQECLVFEDVPKGILAGKNAHMKVCAVEDDFSASQIARKKELADYYIKSYHDIFTKKYEVL